MQIDRELMTWHRAGRHLAGVLFYLCLSLFILAVLARLAGLL